MYTLLSPIAERLPNELQAGMERDQRCMAIFTTTGCYVGGAWLENEDQLVLIYPLAERADSVNVIDLAHPDSLDRLSECITDLAIAARDQWL